MPHPRVEKIFARIPDYPYAHWRRRRSRRERVVELAVDHAVRDIEDHVKRVVVKQGTEILRVLE